MEDFTSAYNELRFGGNTEAAGRIFVLLERLETALLVRGQRDIDTTHRGERRVATEGRLAAPRVHRARRRLHAAAHSPRTDFGPGAGTTTSRSFSRSFAA